MEKESDGFVEVEKNFENIKIWILKVHSRLPKIRVAFLLWYVLYLNLVYSHLPAVAF